MELFGEFKKGLRHWGWDSFDERNLQPYYRRYQTQRDGRPPVAVGPLDELGQAALAEYAEPEPYRELEYVLELHEPAVVEPLHGMVVLRGKQIAWPLLKIHRTVSVLPPYFPEFKARQIFARRVPTALLLRHHYGETNYYHFYSDVLSIFFALKPFPEYLRLPWIVSRAQWNMPFFQSFVKKLQSGTQWIIQDGFNIQVERLVVAKSLPFTLEWVSQIHDWLKVPDLKVREGRRIFIKRARGRRRALENREEIEALCSSFGFESVDLDILTLDQQIRLFQNARHVVAEHGAGNTNIIFRKGASLSLLELFPPDHYSTCYYLICCLLGFSHQLLRGEGTMDCYRINPRCFRNALTRLLEN